MAASKFTGSYSKMRIVSDNGEKGGVLEVPVFRVTNRVDMRKTAGGGDGYAKIPKKVLEEIVANFPKLPKPVGVYMNHQREKETPHEGVVVDAFIEGDLLWNRMDLGPKLFRQMVNKGWSGASIEAEMDKSTPTVDLQGWVQTGVVVTNDPALDIQYIAASEDSTSLVDRIRGGISWAAELGPEKENEMAKTEIQMAEEKIVSLEAKLADALKLADRVKELELQNAELSKRPAPEKLVALEAQVASLQEDGIKTKVEKICLDSINAGKPASFFEGWKEDPIKFLKTRFSGNVDALRASADALPVVVKVGTTGTGSGGNQLGDGSAPKDKLFSEIKKVAAEKKLSFSDATDHVKETNPELYQSGMADYHATPLRNADNGE